MPSLRTDLLNRVFRLPKPKRTSDALLPLFEAVSNSIHSTQAKWKKSTAKSGRIDVSIEKAVGRRPLTLTVSDNGLGLDSKNFDAFTTTDTDNKIDIGGKGVGRLLWLDCFPAIAVDSTYAAGTRNRRRSFQFKLSNDDQLSNYKDEPAPSGNTGFNVTFKGLRDNGYSAKFPTRLSYVFQHFMSHFLPTFIAGNCPTIVVDCNGETRTYPKAIQDHIHRTEEIASIASSYGNFRLVLLECDKVMSSDLKGTHFIHFIAHGRTVKSQKIDSKLGLGPFGPDNHVFHACLFGTYLDKNVNQERTDFTFEEKVIDEIVNSVCMAHVEKFLKAPIEKQQTAQSDKIVRIVGTYPSVAFGKVPELRKYVPLGELEDDVIYGHLSRERYRRDEKQAEKIRSVLSKLKGDKVNPNEFKEIVSEAAAALEETSQRSLAEYIVRRKVVLDFLEILIQKVRSDTADSSYQKEDALHNFICPVRVTTVGKDATAEQAPSHELWVIDERLTFAQYFSSDVSFNKLAEFYHTDERPDLLVFDRVHGLKQSEHSSRVMLVEFKRPGRTNYPDHENPHLQIERYVKRLLSGAELDVAGRPVRLKPDTVFYCFIVADRVGKLEEWTYSWSPTTDGRGRIYQPRDGFNGSIELIEWDSLISDAKERNQAFFEKAGIGTENLFSSARTKRTVSSRGPKLTPKVA